MALKEFTNLLTARANQQYPIFDYPEVAKSLEGLSAEELALAIATARQLLTGKLIEARGPVLEAFRDHPSYSQWHHERLIAELPSLLFPQGPPSMFGTSSAGSSTAQAVGDHSKHRANNQRLN